MAFTSLPPAPPPTPTLSSSACSSSSVNTAIGNIWTLEEGKSPLIEGYDLKKSVIYCKDFICQFVNFGDTGGKIFFYFPGERTRNHLNARDAEQYWKKLSHQGRVMLFNEIKNFIQYPFTPYNSRFTCRIIAMDIIFALLSCEVLNRLTPEGCSIKKQEYNLMKNSIYEFLGTNPDNEKILSGALGKLLRTIYPESHIRPTNLMRFRDNGLDDLRFFAEAYKALLQAFKFIDEKGIKSLIDTKQPLITIKDCKVSNGWWGEILNNHLPTSNVQREANDKVEDQISEEDSYDESLNDQIMTEWEERRKRFCPIPPQQQIPKLSEV